MKQAPRSARITRRGFVRGAAAGVAATVAAPMIVPSRAFGANAPSNRIHVAHIGCGRIARVHDMPGVANSGLADVVAVCDLDTNRVGEGRTLIEKLYREKGVALPAVATVHDYRELLSRKDIDAVVISTPDHQHAEIALAAVHAGKDIYLQKPFTMTHAEGVVLRDAAVKSGRIFQVGSQQRSWEQFRRACEVVRSGRTITVSRIDAYVDKAGKRTHCATGLATLMTVTGRASVRD